MSNYLALLNYNLTRVNASTINYSTLIGSTIIASSIVSNSSINVTNIITQTINYSTLTGSTLTAQTVNYSTLTGSSIATNAMTILGSGNVGIGMNNPGYPLDVFGGTRLMSNVTDTNVTATANSLNIVRYNAPGTWNSNGGMIMFSNTYATNSADIIATGGISGHQSIGGSFGGGLKLWHAVGGTLTVGMTLSGNGSVSIPGSLSKGSGTFDIEHPLYPNTNKRLIHSFIEGPRCDLIYRGTVALTNGSATVYIDKQCTYTQEDAMDNGTFEALCANPDVFLQNRTGFNRVVGSIYQGILTITCENNTSTDMISWMVIAERKDPFVKQWNRTDSNGYLNTQYTKDNL